MREKDLRLSELFRVIPICMRTRALF